MKKHLLKLAVVLGVVIFLVGLTLSFSVKAQTTLTLKQELGQFLYFDKNLSEPAGQSCADCHDPAFGFDDPDDTLPVSEGVIPGLFGGRNSPISAYAMYSSMLYFDEIEGLWIGGLFWDGRATGQILGDPLADQAVGPFLNPVEMANTSKWQVVRDIAASSYASLYEQVWGTDLTLITETDTAAIDMAYDRIGLSIAEFERSPLFGQFSSRYDRYLAACIMSGGDMDACAKGQGNIAKKTAAKYLTSEEWDGLQLFMGMNNNDGILQKGEGAMCAACHVADWTLAADYSLPIQEPAWAPAGWVPPLFTDFTYDNLGIPQNTEFPLAGAAVDYGLGSIVMDPAENGKFKVSTLREIGLSAPYGHNGYFKTLKDIVHFYNTRDVPGAMKGMDWPMAEVPETVNNTELGNLGLTDNDEDALVEFLKSLSDGTKP